MTTCPACGIEIPPTAISQTLKAARCPGCDALTDLGGGLVRRSSRRQRGEALLPTPDRWVIAAGPRDLKVTWRWYSWQTLIMIPFTLFWNGLMLTMATGITDQWRHPERALMGLALPHVWVGVALIYYTLASLLNSTTVEAKDGVLTVHHGPMPWLGGRKVEAREIEQLFVLEKHQKNTRTFELCAMLSNGRKQSMVTGLKGADQARFLEVRLEAVLDIQDVQVEGEVPRQR